MSLDAGDGMLPLLAGSVGLLGVAALGLTLVTGWRGGIGLSVGLLALGYLARVVVVGSAAPEILASVSVALVLVGELGQWSLDRRLRGTYERPLLMGRAVGLAWLVALGAGAAVLGLAVTGIPVPGGIATQAAAIAASVALLALVASVARGKGGGDDRLRTDE